MSEKRFEVLNHYGVPKSVYDSEKDDVLGIGEVVGLLNTLHQENLSLKEKRFNPSNFECKEEVWDLLEKQAIVIEDLEKHNEELRELNEETRFGLQQCKNKNKELYKKLDWICEQTGYDGAKFHYIGKGGE